jgi:hypothetical protein
VRPSLRGMDQDVSDVQRGERVQMPWCSVGIAVKIRAPQTPSALRLRLRTQHHRTTTSRTRRVSDRAPCYAGPDARGIATRLRVPGSPYRLGSSSLVTVCGCSHLDISITQSPCKPRQLTQRERRLRLSLHLPCPRPIATLPLPTPDCTGSAQQKAPRRLLSVPHPFISHPRLQFHLLTTRC